MNFIFDISQLVTELTMSRAQFRSITQTAVEAATYATYEQIHKEANSALKGTRLIYKRNINYPVIGRLKGTITLTGQLPNMIEQGMPPFDMKNGFSRSAKAKRSKKGGWYLTIPFRFAVPSSVGESEAFSGILPPEVHELAKGLTPQRTAFGQIAQKGEQLSGAALAPTGFGVLGKRSKITGAPQLSSAQKAEYTHKAPIHQGIVKQVKFYEKAQSARYNTFRRVSDKSAANSWIHKGLTAKNLMPKAMVNAQLDDIVTKVVTAGVAGL